MIPGGLTRRECVFGNSPVLAVYGDSQRALTASGFRWCTETGHEDARLFILGGKTTDIARITAPAEAIELFRTANVLIKGYDELRFGDWYGKATSLVDIEKHTAVVSVPCLGHYHREFIPRLVVRPILDRLLGACGYTTLHAASAEKNERGVLICGATGSGKSTLLAGLLDRGYGYLSDDRALLKRSRDKRSLLCSYPEDMRLQKTSQGPKYRIMPESKADGVVFPAHIVFLEHNGGDGVTPVRIGAAETAARLTAFIAPFTEQTEFIRSCNLFADIAEHIPAFVIAGKGDTDIRCGNVASLLDT